MLSSSVLPDDIDPKMKAAESLFEQGHTAESKEAFEDLRTRLQNLPPSSQLGFVLNGLSKIAAAGGDYKDAVQLAKHSATIYHQVRDFAGEAHSLNNEGIAEVQMGEYPQAQKTLEAALIISQGAGDSENRVQILNNLGSSYYFPGSYSEAMHRYDAAMALVQQNETANWSDYWRQITSFNQATLFQKLGRYEDALQIYRQVEGSSKSLTPGDRAHLYANLGALYRRLGDPYKALDTYRSAQRLYAEQHDAAGELTVLKNVGIVYALDMEDLRQAEKMFLSAIRLAHGTNNKREEMQAQLYLGETLFRGGVFPQAKIAFEHAYALSGELATAEEQWKALYGLGRTAEQDGNESIAEESYRDAISVIEKTRSQLQLSVLRAEFFADKREAYDALIGMLLRKNSIADAFLFLERSRARNFQDRVSVRKGDQHDLPPTFEEARAALPPATALFEYWTSGNSVGVVWCTRNKSGIMIKDFSSEEMNQIHDLLEGVPNILGSDWEERFSKLSDLIPLNPDDLAEIRHLLIVPDGWISYVPFDLLQPRQNPKVALIEAYDIRYLPTAALLRRGHGDAHLPLPPWSEELVAFGDPVFSGGGISGSNRAETEGPKELPFSRQEVLSIASFTRGRSQLLLENDDLKSLFLSPAANKAITLHVSTHAFADGDNPENSRLLFSPRSAGEGSEYVFLRELYQLDLSHVQLATISACNTERGKISRGEGVQAFSRALLSAGAASSITTLWRVEDQQTSEFMNQFYFLLLRKRMPPAQALRITKLKFLHSNSKLAEPSVWAAFVLNGDGATPVPRVVSWTELALSGLGFLTFVALITISIFLRSRRRVNR